MRIDHEHAYDQRIFDQDTIKEHLIPEQEFKAFIAGVIKTYGSLKHVYWIVDLVAVLKPAEFPDQRKAALKNIIHKIFTYYDTSEIPTKQHVALLKAKGTPIKDIAKILNISRNSVYYHLKQEEELPTSCMLTYGEYNLMMDFWDIWNELRAL